MAKLTKNEIYELKKEVKKDYGLYIDVSIFDMGWGYHDTKGKAYKCIEVIKELSGVVELAAEELFEFLETKRNYSAVNFYINLSAKRCFELVNEHKNKKLLLNGLKGEIEIAREHFKSYIENGSCIAVSGDFWIDNKQDLKNLIEELQYFEENFKEK